MKPLYIVVDGDFMDSSAGYPALHTLATSTFVNRSEAIAACTGNEPKTVLQLCVDFVYEPDPIEYYGEPE